MEEKEISEIKEVNEVKETATQTKNYDEAYCHSCGKVIKKEAFVCPYCGVKNKKDNEGNEKNKIVAALLALFLGSFGVHKFYLKRIGVGIIYILFFWTFIPSIISFIEGIILLCMSDNRFNEKYNS